MQLTVRSGPDDEVVRLGCEGTVSSADISADGGDPLEQLLGEDVFSRRVLLDMNKVPFIDSSGVSWLISRHGRFADGGGILVLHSVPPVVQQVFDLLRLHQVLNLARDEAAAYAVASKGKE